MLDCFILKKLLTSLLVTVGVVAGAIGATRAFFSDTETSSNNIFQAGVLDLLIDNTSYYNGVLSAETSWELGDLPGHLFFNFTDIKPGDVGEDTISIHVNDNEAWACMAMTLTQNIDNTCTEPENIDDPTCTPGPEATGSGELAQNVNFVFWIDDGDNVLESNEATPGAILAQDSAANVLNSSFALADSTTNKFGGPVGEGLDPQTTYYIGKAWCFGDLTLAPLAQDGVNNLVTPADTTGGITCDGSLLNNATQSDILKADVQFSAVQHRNNPNFRCDGATPTPTPTSTPTITPTPTPTPFACGPNDAIFASSESDNDQGLRKDSTAVLANRSIPSAAFNAPQTSGADSDAGFPVGSFFSLGFPLGGNTASIVFGFAEPFYNDGTLAPDLQVFEVTGGVYPDEKVKIEAGAASTGPWTVLAASATRDEAVDLGSLTSAQFVKLTDVSDITIFSGTGDATPDGYDLDAIKAFCTAATQ